MILATRGIVLHKFRYLEKDFIVQIFTEDKGKLSFLVKNSKRNKSLLAIFQPMAGVYLQFKYNEKKEIHYISESSPIHHAGLDLYADPIKGTLTFFMAELLKNSLYPCYPNQELFGFCLNSTQQLYQADQQQLALYPSYYTLMICSHLGIGIPDILDAEYFDLLNGSSSSCKPEHKEYICSQEIELLKSLLGIDFDALTNLKAAKSVRLNLLRSLMKYIEFQMEHFKELKSLDILEQLFNH